MGAQPKHPRNDVEQNLDLANIPNEGPIKKPWWPFVAVSTSIGATFSGIAWWLYRHPKKLSLEEQRQKALKEANEKVKQALKSCDLNTLIKLVPYGAFDASHTKLERFCRTDEDNILLAFAATLSIINEQLYQHRINNNSSGPFMNDIFECLLEIQMDSSRFHAFYPWIDFIAQYPGKADPNIPFMQYVFLESVKSFAPTNIKPGMKDKAMINILQILFTKRFPPDWASKPGLPFPEKQHHYQAFTLDRLLRFISKGYAEEKWLELFLRAGALEIFSSEYHPDYAKSIMTNKPFLGKLPANSNELLLLYYGFSVLNLPNEFQTSFNYILQQDKYSSLIAEYRTQDGLSLLHLAVLYNNGRIERDKDGTLLKEVPNGHFNAQVETLLQKGWIDVNLKANATGGKTPLDLAKESGNQASLELLKKYGAK